MKDNKVAINAYQENSMIEKVEDKTNNTDTKPKVIKQPVESIAKEDHFIDHPVKSNKKPFAYSKWQKRPRRANKDSEVAKALRPPRPMPCQDVLREMLISKNVYEKIVKTIGSLPAESGGMLLGDADTYEILDFVFDHKADNTGVSYQPNTKFLNSVLEEHPHEFIGIVHSHPAGFRHLSMQDQRAAWSNLTSPGNPHLKAYLMPIVQTKPDTGKFELIPYIVTCDPHGNGKVVIHRPKLKII